MAKTLTMLGAQEVTALRGQMAEQIVTKADIVCLDNKAQAAFLKMNGPSASHGHYTIDLLDKNDAVVRSETGPASQVNLSTEAGAAAASAFDNPGSNRIGWIVDAASFSTGKVKIAFKGTLGGATHTVIMNTDGAGRVLELKYTGNGTWEAEVPFTVSEA